MFWLLASVGNAALLSSLALTWTVRRLARSRGWMSGPASERHVHTLPIPRLGGVGIFLSLVLTVAVVALAGWRSRFLVTSLLPACWMFAVGLIDDLLDVRAWGKLAAQVLAGTGLFFLGIRIPAGSGELALLVSLTATIGWTVLLTNAINLIDGLDGLASGSVLCTIGAILTAALIFRQQDTALLTVALAGAVLGFLKFNVSPATIFLGDSGTLTVGAVIAAISIRLIQASSLAWILCILALAHPLAEVAISSTRRLLTANPIFRPDRRHMHHRLMDRSLTHGKSTATLVAISFVFSCLAVLALAGGVWTVLAIAIAALVGIYAMRAFQYDEFELTRHTLAKILDQRYSIDAHVQLREIAKLLDKAPSPSLADLRGLLEDVFSGLGFAAVMLILPELDRQQRLEPLHTGVQLEFPLNSRTEILGSLRLRWDLHCPVPIDLALFSTEFLPVLTRSVQWHLRAYRETGLGPVHALHRKGQRPRLVPVFREVESLGTQSDFTPVRN